MVRMYRASIARSLATPLLPLLSAALMFSPVVAHAQEQICQWANTEQCSESQYKSGATCQCAVPTGIIFGKCTGVRICTGTAVQGPDGKLTQLRSSMTLTTESPGFFDGALSWINKNPLVAGLGLGVGMQLLSSLMSPSGGGGDTGGSNPIYSSGSCTTQYYYTSNTASLSDPCAIYDPSGGANTSTAYTPDNGISDLLRNLQNPINPSININIPTSTTPLYNLLNPISSSSSCPSVQISPNCGQGMVARDNGFDGNGCRLGATCVSDLSSIATSPGLPTLPTGSIDMPIPPIDTGSSIVINTPDPLDLANLNTGTSGIGSDIRTNTNTPLSNTPAVNNTSNDTGASVNNNSTTGGATGTTGTGTGGSAPAYEVPVSIALQSTLYYANTTSPSTPSPSQTPLNQKKIPVPANGVKGDIRSFGKGATIYANNRNDNTEVAGFFGSSSTAARLCQSRPWSKNFLSFVIPASFFDNLCTSAGYPLGTSAGSAQGGGTGGSTRASQKTSIGAPTSGTANGKLGTQQPQVKIWARPASVSIGGRTTIFWTSQYVTACTESSSDGNFSGSSTSGGASTVALSGPVTFTIQCRAIDGSMISGSTTVNIGI